MPFTFLHRCFFFCVFWKINKMCHCVWLHIVTWFTVLFFFYKSKQSTIQSSSYCWALLLLRCFTPVCVCLCKITLYGCGTSRPTPWWPSLAVWRATATKSSVLWVCWLTFDLWPKPSTPSLCCVCVCGRTLTCWGRRLCHVGWITPWSCGGLTQREC